MNLPANITPEFLATPWGYAVYRDRVVVGPLIELGSEMESHVHEILSLSLMTPALYSTPVAPKGGFPKRQMTRQESERVIAMARFVVDAVMDRAAHSPEVQEIVRERQKNA